MDVVRIEIDVTEEQGKKGTYRKKKIVRIN